MASRRKPLDWTEREVTRYLTHLSARYGCEIRKVRWEGRNYAPDYVILFPGGALCWVEAKGKNLHPTAGQRHEHIVMQNLGQDVRTINSFDGADELFSDYIEEFEYSPLV